MGRELTEERIELLINDENALNKYLTKGPAELHWHNQKLTHYQLLEKLLDSDWKLELLSESEFIYKFKEGTIDKIVNRINKKLPKEWEHYKIPDSRKLLISKIVSLRVNALKNIFSARV